MTAEQFAYWMQGFDELNDAPPSAQQWQAIRVHLGLVFSKVTPNYFRPGDHRAIQVPAYMQGPLKAVC